MPFLLGRNPYRLARSLRRVCIRRLLESVRIRFEVFRRRPAVRATDQRPSAPIRGHLTGQRNKLHLPLRHQSVFDGGVHDLTEATYVHGVADQRAWSRLCTRPPARQRFALNAGGYRGLIAGSEVRRTRSAEVVGSNPTRSTRFFANLDDRQTRSSATYITGPISRSYIRCGTGALPTPAQVYVGSDSHITK